MSETQARPKKLVELNDLQLSFNPGKSNEVKAKIGRAHV